MHDDDIDYAALGRRVEEGVQRSKRALRLTMFAVSLFLFALFMFIAWVAVPATSVPLTGDAIGAMIMLTIGWAVSLFLQGMALTPDTAAGERQIREQAMSREIQRIFEARALDEMRAVEHLQRKAKRGERVAISDDGELVELVDDDSDLREAVLREQSKRRGL